AEPHCLRAEQGLDVDRLGAEADAEPAERTAAWPIERLQRGGDLRCGQAAETVSQLINQAAPGGAKRQALRSEQRRQSALDLCPHEQLQPLAYPLARLAVEKIARAQLESRRQHRLAGNQPADQGAAPQQAAGRIERKGF